MSARGVVAIGIGLVLVAGGLVVGDRFAASLAEQQLADQIGARLEVTGEPDVQIDGFPFLTQLASGTFSHVTVDVDGAVLDGVQATDVTMDARGVTRGDPVTVDQLEASLTLPAATVQDAAAERTGLAVTVVVQGDAMQGSMDVLGVPLAATFVPRVDGGRLLVDTTSLSLGGLSVDAASLPGGLGERLTGLEVPVDGLPEGVELTDAQVVAGGVRITAAGTDVALTSP
ncbi:LmeA family phospholipid-binding protein [Cellulomonas soli]|uniref:LmeA family phospholipid-binding protein n=1 Tax=Cellulomonas soli TaxID=931535 RepID=UPI003F82D559